MSAGPSVTVCRGCCCGTAEKYPDVDHEARLERLRDAVRGHARVRISECLGTCERSDVVVVSPTGLGRALGGRPVWLSCEADARLAAVADWVCAGGPGLAPCPVELAAAVFRAP